MQQQQFVNQCSEACTSHHSAHKIDFTHSWTTRLVNKIIRNPACFLAFFLVISATATAHQTKNASRLISLFNRKDLTHWKISDFGTQGEVNVRAGSLILGMGDGATGVSWDGDFEFPKMNYEVSLQAERIAGNDFFCGMTFPVNDSYLTLIVGGWGGFLVGLSSLEGLDASENETGSLHKFENKHWYAIRLSVADGIVQAWIDDQRVVDVDTKGRELSIRPEVLLSRPFGFVSWYTEAALRNITLTLLDEPAKPKDVN